MKLLCLSFLPFLIAPLFIFPKEAKSQELKDNVKTANATILASSEKSDHNATLANDYNFASYWEATSATNQTLSLDLGEVRVLKTVTQVFNEDDIWYFVIEASEDGVNYFTLLDDSFGVYGQTFQKSISGNARYIRLSVEKSEKGLIPSSKEFYVDTGTYLDGIDVSSGMKGIASTEQNLYSASKAFDDDYGTYWCAAGGDYPQSLACTWDNAVYAKTIEITIQDHGNYEFILKVKLSTGEWRELNNATLSGSYFRFDVNDYITDIDYNVTKGPGWANITEVRVLGFEEITNDVGNGKYFISNIVSSSNIEISEDGTNFNKVSDKNNVNKVVKAIRGLAEGDKVYGFSADQILNLNFGGKMSSYVDEKHHISKATDTLRHPDSDNSYYQSEFVGQDDWISFDLGNPCFIDKIYQKFNENDVHKFYVEASLDDVNYEVIYDERNSSVSGQEYVKVLANPVKARFIRLNFVASETLYATSNTFYIFGNGSSVIENWWQDTSGVVRFYPKEQKSTLREITSRLDEFRYSGYRVIELHQPYEGMADIWAGLGGTNNYQVDPIIGNLSDLTYLLQEAHKKGIKVFMFGNVGYGKADSDVFLKAQKDHALGIKSREEKFFLFSDKCADPTKWFWSDIANAYYYGYWGEDGQIPTYNFENEEWQNETYNYIKFWAEFGVDGVALDAPNVYYYGSADSTRITFKNITSTLRKHNLFSIPEGSGDVSFISNYKYSAVQNYNITSWGAGALSLGLIAAQTHSAAEVDGWVKSIRDNAVALGGVAIDGMNFEDNYEEASTTDRILESALVTTTGHMAFLHIGSSAKIGQDIMKTWPADRQYGVAKSFALQNSLSSLNASGERVSCPTDYDVRYYSFYKSNTNGNAKSLVLINYKNSDAEVEVTIKGTPLKSEAIKLYDAYNDEYFDLKADETGTIIIPCVANSHRVFIMR